MSLNLSFYTLLARQLGLLPALVGIDGLHHLVAVAVVPVAIGVWLCSDVFRTDSVAAATREPAAQRRAVS